MTLVVLWALSWVGWVLRKLVSCPECDGRPCIVNLWENR